MKEISFTKLKLIQLSTPFSLLDLWLTGIKTKESSPSKSERIVWIVWSKSSFEPFEEVLKLSLMMLWYILDFIISILFFWAFELWKTRRKNSKINFTCQKQSKCNFFNVFIYFEDKYESLGAYQKINSSAKSQDFLLLSFL